MAYPDINSQKNSLLNLLLMAPMPTFFWVQHILPVGSVAAHAREQGSDLHPFLLLQRDAQLLTTEPEGSPQTRHEISKREIKVGTEIERSLH